jgi:hypothetical protein
MNANHKEGKSVAIIGAGISGLFEKKLRGIS